jgi:hypothetical protein
MVLTPLLGVPPVCLFQAFRGAIKLFMLSNKNFTAYPTDVSTSREISDWIDPVFIFMVIFKALLSVLCGNLIFRAVRAVPLLPALHGIGLSAAFAHRRAAYLPDGPSTFTGMILVHLLPLSIVAALRAIIRARAALKRPTAFAANMVD